MIVKTRAVILRETKYRDQSKICSIYTREFGKLSVIIKGARNPKNRLCGLFNAGNIVDLVLYKKQGRDIQLVSDGNLVSSPMVPAPDIERFAVLCQIIDLVRQTTEHGEKSLPLFTLLAGTLEQLYRTNINFRELYLWFLLHFVSVLGFQPSLQKCVFSERELATAITSMKLSELYFVMNPGGLALPGATDGRISGKTLIPVHLALQLGTLATARIPPEAAVIADSAEVDMLCNILHEYCALHLDHVRTQKKNGIVSQMLQQ